jgi:NTP pyrophosphatase (non-canonical NTP hydrolase)
MDLQVLSKRAIEIRQKYDDYNSKNFQKWELDQLAQGFVGDVGDLMKLVMRKQNYRGGEGNLDEQLSHEVCDCLWSILVIAEKLGIKLDEEFMKNMDDLETRIERLQKS